MVLQAFIYLFVAGFVILLVVLVLCAYAVMGGQKIIQNRQNMQIKNMLKNAAKLKINFTELQAGNECPICFEEFKNSDDIVCLPCNRNHVFHESCIGEWVKRNSSCPLCKTVVTVEAIEMADTELRRPLADLP